jgi:transposase
MRERIVEAYEGKEGRREEEAKRFKVSLGMVKKQLAQKARTGDLRPRHRFSGRKARLMPEHGKELKGLVSREPDLTLVEIQERLGLACTAPAIHRVLAKLGLTYKKRRSMPRSQTGPMSRKRAGGGSEARAGSTLRGWSSSTSRRPRRT